MKKEPAAAIDDAADLRLVKETLKGKRRAFDRLVLEHQRRIYFTVLKIVLDHDAADDIVQDSFVRAWTHLRQFDQSRPFYPWLQRIALNTALNYRKKAVREDRRRENDHPDGEPEAGADPLQEVIGRELRDGIHRAMAGLPADQRAVLVLRTQEGLSYREISEQLGIPEGTVMSKLSRARERLKKELRPFIGELSIED
ncbi:sigma-70 family RNA polymerase sigma factor [bacterium]|nr:sigma-70 family RNA polymerase sigma factor [bacterium]